MTPQAVADAWYRAMRAVGESATLRRTANGSADVDATVYVKAIREPIRDSVDELEGQSSTTARRYLILYADIGSWPLPIKRNDQLIVGGVTMIIQAVDKTTRRIAGQQVAIEVEAWGG